jgi:hypothetical protein
LASGSGEQHGTLINQMGLSFVINPQTTFWNFQTKEMQHEKEGAFYASIE